MEKPRLLRITTVPISLHVLLTGQFRYMTEHGFDVLTTSANGKEVIDVVAEGVDHVVIPFTRRMTPLRDLYCLWKLVRLMRKFQPHIVHTHTPKAGLLGMMAAKITAVPIRLHTVAGLPFMEASGVKQWILKQAERTTYRLAHKVYPNSFGLRVYMAETLGASTEKFVVLGHGSSNGVDVQYFNRTPALSHQAQKIRDGHKIPTGDFVFCFVGRIVRDKGIVELVEAFDRLASGYHDAWLLIIGHFEPDLDPLPKATLETLKHNPRIVLAGFQNDVRPWLLASDALILLSYREGFPNVVMQAFAMEIPCIVSNINGSNELVIDRETGFIVPPKDAMRTYHVMVGLLQNRNCREMGRKGREIVAQRFDQRIFWKLLFDEYRSGLQTVFKMEEFGLS